MCGNYSLIKFANFLIIVLRAEIGTIKAESSSNFRTLHNNEKICKLCKAIFSTHYNIFQPNFGILLLLKGSFRECSFLGQDVSRTKISLYSIRKIVYRISAFLLTCKHAWLKPFFLKRLPQFVDKFFHKCIAIRNIKIHIYYTDCIQNILHALFNFFTVLNWICSRWTKCYISPSALLYDAFVRAFNNAF